MIDNIGGGFKYPIYRLLSRNETAKNQEASEEEYLQEMIDELKIEFNKDLNARTEKGELLGEDEDYAEYEDYSKLLKAKAELFKGVNSGFRKLACTRVFMLGLIMTSRVRRHYVHSPWFRVSSLAKMVEVHGAVSDQGPVIRLIRVCDVRLGVSVDLRGWLTSGLRSF